MSEMIVKVQRVTNITVHPNADLLEVVHLGAWTTCSKIGMFSIGDLVVFIPPDAILPEALHLFLGITNYLGRMPQSSEEAKQGKRRVRATHLRGVKSFGVLMTLEDVNNYLGSVHGVAPWCKLDKSITQEGVDFAKVLGITKYTPPEKIVSGDAEAEHTLFGKYVEIENYKNFPDVIQDGEAIVVLEKVHGSSVRCGLVKTDGGPIFMCGSHRVNRKKIDAKGNLSVYWTPLENPNVQDMLEVLYERNNAVSVTAYFELIGQGIQDLTYGVSGITYLLFDISVNGEYMNWEGVVRACKEHDVRTVPELYRGPFSKEILEEHTDGPTMVCDRDVLSCSFKNREGVVVKPLCERTSDLLPNCGRAILKSVSCLYLERKNPQDNA